ncbi:class IV lanthionine synthetase LanL [Kitasatospora sp. NPDC059646]|uniref:class IV lanthionine synthetase LanL n=1 Tax=Kitasatospora sp. NPDC059646 TaxID=3346893 RepID=UPI0036755F4C
MDHHRDAPFSTLVRSVLDRTGPDWPQVDAPPWIQHFPPHYRPRAQGWKIHVSATPLSATEVLRRAAAVLAARSCAFKHAADTREVERLTATRCERAAGGKFLTAYPDDDPHFRAVAEDLARTLDGLPGPAVLSDRPVRPGGIVSYRYGVFAAPPRLNNDGSFEPVLAAPDGTLVPDRPPPWFEPPAWTSDPLGAQPADETSELLVGGRFEVSGAIRHAYRGGVYRAVDRATGAPVILKQARRHVAVSADGTDVRDLLRGEAAALGALAASGLAPRPIGLVEQDGDLFLAQSEIPGVTLEQWVGDRVARDRGTPLDAATDLARQIVAAAEAITREGLVWLDLNPGNLMVGPDGRIRLVDLEGLVEPGRRSTPMYTPGYAAPEQLADPSVPVAGTTGYGLGATLFFLATGIHPALADDDRPRHRRLTDWLAALAADNPAARRLLPLITALTADDPRLRWTPARARAFLAHPPAAPPPPPPPPVSAERILRDGLAHTLATMDPADPARLWPAPDDLRACDPRAVQHGAAGVLAVLDRAHRTLPDPDPALPPALASAAGWLDARMTGRQRLLPGLYFGHAGTAWALYDAATTLHDPALADRALDLAARLPTRWPNPDVCHGAAGSGLAHLALRQRTGDARFADRARACAASVLDGARHTPDGVRWPVPDAFDSALRGLAHLGYAHGVAGIGLFLLLAGRQLPDGRCLEAAGQAADALFRTAVVEDGAAWWPVGEEPPGTAPLHLPHWCSGSSGIGTFLIRYARETGDGRAHELAAGAALAVRRARRHASAGSCHGLAGNGEFLLDLAEATGERRYRQWAEDLYDALQWRAVLRDGRHLVPDESGRTVTTGYGTGLSGVLAFLLRLRHGGPRLWIPEPATEGVRPR